MVLTPGNIVMLSGGLTRDPEVYQDSVVRIGLAVSGAGHKDNEYTGYFDVVFFLKSDNERHSQFVRDQIADGKLKKGSQINIVGKLRHDPWTDQETGKKRSKVEIVAETISYVPRSASASDSTASATINVPDSF